MESDIERDDRSRMSEYSNRMTKINGLFRAIVLINACLMSLILTISLIVLCFLDTNNENRHFYIGTLMTLVGLFMPSPLQFSMSKR